MGDLGETLRLVREFFLHGFVAGIVVGIVAPWLGTLLVVRNLPFLAVAIPELAGAGVALSYLVTPVAAEILGSALSSEPAQPSAAAQMAGAAIAILVGLGLIALLGRRARHAGLYAAVAYVIAAGLAEVFLLESRFHEFTGEWLHHGRLLNVLEGESRIAVAASLLALSVVLATSRRLWIAAFDPDLLALKGRSVACWLFVTLSIVGGFAAVVVPEVGPDVVLPLLLIPPIILRGAVPSLALFGPLSSLAGLLGVLSAFHLAVVRDWPIGASITLSVIASSLLVHGAVRPFRRTRAMVRR